MNIKECYESLFSNEIIEYTLIVREVIDDILTINKRTVPFPVRIVRMLINKDGNPVVKIRMLVDQEITDEIKQQYEEAFMIKEKIGKNFSLTDGSEMSCENLEKLQRRSDEYKRV
jgi:hypothetical protein